MDVLEYPRIGNRSDALELLDRLIEESDNPAAETALEALRDAIEREVV
ncbi:MAG: hypothetical protein LBC31_12735 [Treponema sp.]|jgi:hypothetical protein|nr:hypothetical protein [Treponema sp.]